MKLCKDCTHFLAPTNGLSAAEYGKCRDNKIMSISPVTGELVPKFSADFAVTLRRDEKQCGPEAAWFEPKAEQPAPAEACSEVGHG